eukprot:12916695-Prorocentrum_lima.AAC.1
MFRGLPAAPLTVVAGSVSKLVREFVGKGVDLAEKITSAAERAVLGRPRGEELDSPRGDAVDSPRG